MSDATTALADAGQGAAPVEPTQPENQPAPGQPTEPSVQSTPEPQEQSPSGQDLIAPYLEGVDDAVRDQVAERLERYRKDADANFNQRFEQTSQRLKAYETLAEDPSALETPVALYDNLMQNPLETLDWIVDRFKEELGVDLRSQVLQKWGAQPGETPPQTQEPQVSDEDQPLTRKQFEALQREQAEQAAQQQAAQEAKTTAEGWLNEAASAHGLEIGSEDVAIKEAILRQAASLMPQVRDGQQAIKMAVEAVVNRLAPKPKQPSTDPNAPRVAAGGGPAAPPQVDWSDKRSRQDAMLSILQSTQQAAQ